MTPERWAQVNDVLHRALQLAPPERPKFLNQACASDGELRREVESLLVASDQVASTFLRFPQGVGSTKGTRLGDYEVQSLLGSGGMGEVYRARDLRLRRDVAIKVLPAYVSSDPERLRRFEQEALSTAALNHPNILAVYQMGSHEGVPYLVTELLEGETLREKIRGRRIAVPKAIDYAVQVARGLTAAHDKGIVHRDLKPDNIFVTKDGRIKILDFGLAKLTQAPQSSPHSSPTLGSETEPGMVMGTAGYMAPEQVRGETVDRRADIFAFGAVLYEMLAGRRAFQKPTSVETMTAILNEEPAPLAHVAPQIPPALQRVVARCLEKNAAQRFQSASDLAFALEELSGFPAPGRGVEKDVRTRHKLRLALIGWALAGLAALAVLAILTSYWPIREDNASNKRATKLDEKDTIVLADFTNSTGDPIFDDTLKQALAVALRQSAFLNVLSDNRISSTLQLMKLPTNTPLTSEIARELCERASSKAYVGGSISNISSEYIIGLKAVNCQTGDLLAQEQVTATGKEKVLDALGQAAAKLRGELGESLSNIKNLDVPLSQATTSSLEALQAFSLGRKVLHEKGTAAALPFAEHAVALDPEFASGYSALGKMYMNLRQHQRARELYSKAYSLREHASQRERFDIESIYFEGATGDLESAIRVFREWMTVYPHDSTPLVNLALTYSELGQPQQALELSREALQQEPDNVIRHAGVAEMLIGQNRFDEARSVIRDAFDKKTDTTPLHEELYWLAFFANDDKGMADQVAWSVTTPDGMQRILPLEAAAAACRGRLRQSLGLSDQASASYLQAGKREPATTETQAAALREASFGNLPQARVRAASIPQSELGVEGEAFASLAFAFTGDVASARRTLSALDKEYPQGTLVKYVIGPTVLASVELSQKNPQKSIQLLQPAAIYELTTEAFTGCMYQVYVRGLAYLALKDGASAATEFQKILDHTGIVKICETGALARLGLARAYVLQGNTAKAQATYRDFLTFWKDADSDIPILSQAKAESARLIR